MAIDFRPLNKMEKKSIGIDFRPIDTRSSLTKTMASSEPFKPSGDPWIDAGIIAQKEIIGPLAQGVNTALLGAPKYLTQAIAGKDFTSQAFPQQSSLGGKALRIGSEGSGLVFGGVGQVASKVAGKIIPKTGATIGRKILGNAAAGAASGVVAPTEEIEDVKGRALNTVIGAGGGAAIPIAGAAAKKIPVGAKVVAQNIYNNIVRLPISAAKFAKNPLEVFSKEKIVANSTDDFYLKATERLKERSSQLNDAVRNSNKFVNVHDVVNRQLDDAANQAEGSLKDRTAIIEELNYIRNNIYKKYGDLRKLSVQKAVELKRKMADDFPFLQEDPNNINTKAAHKIYHDINEAIEAAHPEIKDLNQRVSGLIDISNAAKNRAMVESRNNPLSVLDAALGVGGGLATGNPLTGIGLVAAKKSLGSVAVQTRVAKALTNMSEVDLSNVLSKNPWLVSGLNKVDSSKLQDKILSLPKPAAEAPAYLRERAGAAIPSLGVKGDPSAMLGSRTPIPLRGPIQKSTIDLSNPNIVKVEPVVIRKGLSSKLEQEAFKKRGGTIIPKKSLGAAALATGLIASNVQAGQIKEPERLSLPAHEFTMLEEGFRAKPYKDSKDNLTIGYGFNLNEPSVRRLIPTEVLAGRRALDKKEATVIFNKLYPRAINDAKLFAGSSWDKLSNNQKKGLVDMAYQLGRAKLSGFEKLKEALDAGNYKKAAYEVLNSNYAKQVKNRANRVSALIRGNVK